MNKKRTLISLFILLFFLSLAAICKFLFDLGFLAFGLFCGGIACNFYLFMKTTSAKDEQPCSMVSCCHYLGDRDNDR